MHDDVDAGQPFGEQGVADVARPPQDAVDRRLPDVDPHEAGGVVPRREPLEQGPAQPGRRPGDGDDRRRPLSAAGGRSRRPAPSGAGLASSA